MKLSLNNALHEAVMDRNLAAAQVQVSNFDINAKGEDDKTALILAADYRCTDIAQLLLTFNPDVNMQDVCTLSMISIHLICIFLSHLCV